MEHLLQLILITQNIVGDSLHNRYNIVRFYVKKVHNDWLVFAYFEPSLAVLQLESQVILCCYERSEATDGRLGLDQVLDKLICNVI